MFGENYKADISDLQLEQWLRRRNAGLLVWQTKDGTEIPVKDMTDSHIENAIAYLEKAQAREDAYFEGLSCND